MNNQKFLKQYKQQVPYEIAVNYNFLEYSPNRIYIFQNYIIIINNYVNFIKITS